MQELTINPNRIELDEAYMQMAETWARRSKANRKQVGALIVKDRQIISDGYNGMPAGDVDDVCEYWDHDDQTFRTKQGVLHAESNALMKITENGGVGAQGGTLYTTMSPCSDCAKLIKQAKITRVVFREQYRDDGGIDFLLSRGVQVDHLPHFDASAQAQPVPPSPTISQPQTDRLAQMNSPALMATVVKAVAPAPPIPVSTRPTTREVPVEDEDEVAALLRAHEAQIAQASVPTKEGSSLDAPDNGPYKSTFL